MEINCKTLRDMFGDEQVIAVVIEKNVGLNSDQWRPIVMEKMC